MPKIDSTLALRTHAAQILADVTRLCIEMNLTQVDDKWFGEQIAYFIDHNLLTLHEIDCAFGWRDVEQAEKYHELVTKPRLLQSLPKKSSREFQQRVMAMVGVVAAKYRLYAMFSAEVPFESGASLPDQTVEVTDRYEFLYRPLSSFPKFEAMSTRAKGELNNSRVYVLGDLLNRSESELLRIPNLGRKSVNEIKEAMSYLPHEFGFGCLYNDEKVEFRLRRWFNVNKYRHLRLTGCDWTAPPELVEELKKLGITHMTELATCPQGVLEKFAAWQTDLEQMVDTEYDVEAIGNNLLLQVPNRLDPDVRVFKSLTGDSISPVKTE